MSSALAGRRGAVLLAVGFLVVAVIVLLVMASRDDQDRARADLGEQSDPAVIGRVVEAAVQGNGSALPDGAPAACEGETRRTYGQGLGPLVFAANLRWRGVPAVARAYQVAGATTSGLDHRVFVLSTTGCQLLVAQSL